MGCITVTFCNQKGGVGKTQLTQVVANGLHAMGEKVAMLDCDPQATSFQMRLSDLSEIKDKAKRESLYPIVPVGPRKAGNKIISLGESILEKAQEYDKAGYSYLFLDLPGSMEIEGIKLVYAMADYIFVPTSCSKADIMSSVAYIKWLEKTIKPLKEEHDLIYNVMGVFNRIDPKMTAFKEISANTKEVFGIKFMKSYFPEQKSAFQVNANTVNPYRTSKGFTAVKEFVEEVLNIIKN